MISVEHLLDGGVQLCRVLADRGLELGRDVVERLGDDRVDRHQRAGDRLAGADGAELEAVAGEGERAGAVAVAGVLRQLAAACRRRSSSVPFAFELLGAALGDLLEDVGELLAEEDRDDRRRRLVGAEAMVVGRRWRRPRAAGRANLCTARMTAAQKTRNCALSCGVSPGSSRLPCVVLPNEKLTCLPEPLTPANGFSCSRQTMPYFSATRCSVTMISCWWSVARLAFSNTGATSNWPGATSLWRVLTGMPSLKSSRSHSSMNASTRSGIAPK